MATTRKKKIIKKTSKKKSSKSKSSIFWIAIFVSATVLSVVAWHLFSPDKYRINKNSFLKDIPKGFSSFGIDVSHHQGNIDWKMLLKKEHYDTIIHFIYCKATEGSTHIDTRWNTNRSTLNNMGIPNGAYHFFITKETPRPQAEHFLNHWKKREVDLPPVLDVETEGFSDEDLRAKMTIWLEEVEEQTGMRPIIYTSLSFFNTKFKNYFPNHKFWIAAYSQKPDCIDDEQIMHWQYSENGSLPGIKENIDLNVSKISF